MTAAEHAFWLPVAGLQVAACLHLAEETTPTLGTGVLFLPPFGWAENASHRATRQWASGLAAAGHAVLRIDWPYTGDSSGCSTAPGQLVAWRAAAVAAAAWLRSNTGATRVCGVGLGLGGVVGLQVAAQGCIEELALWGCPASGRGAVRAARAAAALVGGGATRDDDGHLWVFGYPMPPDLQEDLAGLDLATLDLRARRILVLGSSSLAEQLRAAGATVDVVPDPGLEVMVEHPQTSRLPEAAPAELAAWLAAGGETSGTRPTLPELPTEALLPGLAVTEHFLSVASPDGQLRGVLSRPHAAQQAPLTVVLLNSGATRRTGPNRMWVDVGRHWAARGVPVLRLDLAGFGDGGTGEPSPAEDAGYYDERLLRQVRQALDALAPAGLPAERVLLVGLCSGAYWAWHAATDDPRVVGAVLLNPKTLLYSDATAVTMGSQKVRLLGSPEAWRRALGRGWSVQARRTAKALLARVVHHRAYRRARQREQQAMDVALRRLRQSGTRVAVVFGPDEELLLDLRVTRRLALLDRGGPVSLHLLDGHGEDHTLSAPALRRQALAVVDSVVQELADDRAAS